ncbi:CAP domain-containing protein [Hahella aquimaris]|uniref:CAP domain-containing protein n=1 Tax=Hahella sp. HNIBRBA332 TaxID=3015983 RepID=UPI00273CC9C0|nr:CAP domain-containing protein [Hahella sp. HNIBRBA332]WLQ16592.1 CAP domain-containing protein [Hahella sp. HNIBRBA332]
MQFNNIAPILLLTGALSLAGCGGSGGTGGDSVADDGSDDASPTACQMTELDKQLLKAHNQARAQARSCGDKNYDRAPALTWNCKLATAANAHSSDMADNNFFDHTGSNGLSVGARVKYQGYFYQVVGENIAAGYGSVSQVMQGWLDSPGHCANIMSKNYTEMGAARIDASGADYPNYWTTVFGRR